MNSNGIREWLTQTGRSNYRTPRISWWTWLSIGIVIGMLVGSPAHAARGECLSLSEAREVYHGKHLHWRGDHCWSDLRGVRHAASRHSKIRSSGGGAGSRRATVHEGVSYPEAQANLLPSDSLYRSKGEEAPSGPRVGSRIETAGVAPSPPETKEAATASMIEAAAATLGPPAISLGLRVETAFADRWPETQSAISPLRWSRELVEFGSASP